MGESRASRGRRVVHPAAPIAASSASTGAAPRTESSFVSRLWWTTPTGRFQEKSRKGLGSSFVSRLWRTTPSTPPTIRTARSTCSHVGAWRDAPRDAPVPRRHAAFARQPLQTIPSARSRTTRGACSSEAAGAGAGRATKLRQGSGVRAWGGEVWRRQAGTTGAAAQR